MRQESETSKKVRQARKWDKQESDTSKEVRQVRKARQLRQVRQVRQVIQVIQQWFTVPWISVAVMPATRTTKESPFTGKLDK